MSIKVMSSVWDHSTHRGSALLLMLALADHASDDGVCWPGIPRLGRYARCKRRHVRRMLQALEQSGELYIARNAGRGNTNLYYVTIRRSIPQMMQTLIKRLGVGPTEAMPAVERIVALQVDARDAQKGGRLAPFPPQTKEGPQDPKEDPQGEKGASETEKRGDQAPQTIRTITNHHESSLDTDEEAQQWIANLEAQTPTPRGEPRTAEELQEMTRQAEAGWIARLQSEPHLTWGNQSEAAQRALASLDGHGDPVRWLGAEIERLFHLAPDWTAPKKVRRWIATLFDALKAAGYDTDIVIEAGQKLRSDKCTLSGPWAFENTARAIAAERKAGSHDTDTGTGNHGQRWTAADIAAANEAAADALGE